MKKARFVGIKASVLLSLFILGFSSEHLYHLLMLLEQRIRLGLIQPQKSLGPWGLLRAGSGACSV